MLARVLSLGPAPVTRRVLLIGAVGIPMSLSVTACTGDAPVDLPADPDREALEAAQEVEVATLAALEGWPMDANDGTVTRAEVSSAISAHIAALVAALTSTPPAIPSPSGSGSYALIPTLSTAQVVAMLDSAASEHTRALRTASPEISPLLASIAASDAAVAAAIRQSST